MPDIEFLKKLPCPTEGRLPEWYFTFGQRIIILRRALSWSQAHAERMLHAGEGVVRQHEARRRRRPRLALLLRLRRLEAEYAEEVQTYLTVAAADNRKRIRPRRVPFTRPPDLQEALGRIGATEIRGLIYLNKPRSVKRRTKRRCACQA